jgi:hypothetical protein
MTAEERPRFVTAKGIKLSVGFVVVSVILSIALSFLITAIMFGRDNPAPAAGIAWIILACLLFIVFMFLGLIYVVELIHTRTQGGSRVSFRNYGLRLVLSLSSLIGPFWMLDSHPYLSQWPVVLLIVNVLVAGLSIVLLLWALGRKFGVRDRPGSPEGSATGGKADRTGSGSS